MTKVVLEIKTCEECPYHKCSKVYTSDNWDNVRRIYCYQLNKDVHKYLDWYDKSDIPNECPIKSE